LINFPINYFINNNLIIDNQIFLTTIDYLLMIFFFHRNFSLLYEQLIYKNFLSTMDFVIYNKLKKSIVDNFIVNHYFHKNFIKIFIIIDLSFENKIVVIYSFYIL
jgi:hypothetical protein